MTDNDLIRSAIESTRRSLLRAHYREGGVAELLKLTPERFADQVIAEARSRMRARPASMTDVSVSR